MRQTVGVLGLQGDFKMHLRMLNRVGVSSRIVRWPKDLAECSGLILPGGESTTFLNLLHRTGLFDALVGYAETHPIMGTCAGLIIMAGRVINHAMQPLSLLDADVERNAYGRQVDSFSAKIRITISGDSPFEGVFIRAPKIVRTGPGVDVLGWHGDDPVMIREGNKLGLTFHPELTRDPRIHRYFCLDMVES